MDASELILNLVQKAAIKAEVNDNASGPYEILSNSNINFDASSDQHELVKNSFPNLPEKSCDNCKKKKIADRMPKISVTASETLENDKENESRKKIRMERRQMYGNQEKIEEEKIFVLQQLGRSQIHAEGFPTFLCVDGKIADSNGVKRKIPRPANAFMLFANEWRKKLAAENPRESNKDISVRLVSSFNLFKIDIFYKSEKVDFVIIAFLLFKEKSCYGRLGILWKNMAKDVKEKYFALAREVDAEHKRKYPDYVYNPKEARLRKAMREQSRELSRRSILQSAIARAGVIANPVTSAGFLDHQHRFGCVPTGVPPINSSTDPDRIAESWFQSTSRSKPIHSPRMADWYGTVGDPIERLQVMGAMHQRSLEKCKDVMRNQAATSMAHVVTPECAAGFSGNGYPVDFSDISRERDLRRQENIEYTEFGDSQKWHPYQNGGVAHQHSRTTHPSQMSSILHPNIQSPSSHGHGPCSQFCHNVLPRAPTMPRNIGVRGPRHTVLLRDRLPGRHCEFSAEATRMGYSPSNLDLENVRASYLASEHQMPRPLESSVDCTMDSACATKIRREDEGPRWEANRMSMDNLARTTESSVIREKDRDSRRSTERFEAKKKALSKQPLPGFHQAFGSTEIGRFSRSEFFVNMVGENSGNMEATDAESANVSTNRMSEVNGVSATTHDTAMVTTAGATIVRSFSADDSEGTSFDDSNNEVVTPTSDGMYCGQSSTPRWHSPHVGAIGSEI